jgi:hypothetical protein
MLSVSVKHNIQSTIRMLDRRFAKQVPFATAVALTKTAQHGQRAVIEEMKSQFDRPTPFTLKSLFIKPATKQNLQAMVYLKDQSPGGKSRPLSETLGHQFAGGTRVRKRLELWLERAGYISANEYMVPAAGARLDQYGNMSRGQVQQILSQLRAGPDPYSYKSKSARSKKNVKLSGGLFWSRGGKLPRGVWVRGPANSVLPVMLVVTGVRYKRLINMSVVIERVIKKHFETEFKKALEMAIRTAR